MPVKRVSRSKRGSGLMRFRFKVSIMTLCYSNNTRNNIVSSMVVDFRLKVEDLISNFVHGKKKKVAHSHHPNQ